jgi:hypothetical protein
MVTHDGYEGCERAEVLRTVGSTRKADTSGLLGCSWQGSSNSGKKPMAPTRDGLGQGRQDRVNNRPVRVLTVTRPLPR